MSVAENTRTLGSTPERASDSVRLRIAIAGGGPMAHHHAKAIRLLSDAATLVGFAEPNVAARQSMVAACGDAPGFATLAELLDTVQPDVVHVCTPFQTHEEVASRALERGCHVYVEKPFADSVDGSERILALARQRALKVCAGHQLLFEVPALRAASLMAHVGQVVHVESYFSFRAAKRVGPGRPPRRADEQLFDILPHPVYLLLRFLARSAGDANPGMTALEIGPRGTVHAALRCGPTTGNLIVTLEGRPIESYVRIVGTQGSIMADFIRGTVQHLVGPGSSGIDKLLAPYQTSWQLLTGTSAALARRFLKGQRSYPGLVEIFGAFYESIRSGGPSPVSPMEIQETVAICSKVSEAITERFPAPNRPASRRGTVLVTGGTGFLGREVVEALLQQGKAVRVAGRRQPAPWDRLPAVDYVTSDLSQPPDESVWEGVDAVVHCAAETSGGWEEHQKNSIDATRILVEAAARSGVKRLIHVSSLAVASAPSGGWPIDESSPLDADRGRGPYVWGKAESERVTMETGQRLGLHVHVVRPGALVDYRALESPGALGRRIGNIFVAVGWPSQKLWVVDVRFAARVLCWMLEHDDAPAMLHLLEPELPTRRDLLRRLKADSPGLHAVWLPPPLLWPLSWLAVGLQKVLRPRKPAIHLSRVFASKRYDTSRIAALARVIDN